MEDFKHKETSPSQPSLSTLDSFGLTDKGKIRASNEDYFICLPEQKLFIVADGMGGHLAGEVASKETVLFLQKRLTLEGEALSSEKSTSQILTQALIDAHEHILKMAVDNPDCTGMGCTVVVAYIQDGFLHACHVGDARVYISNSSEIKQLGTDHSFVAEAVQEGLLTKEEAKESPFKNRLTMAIGGMAKLAPEYLTHSLKSNNCILLCTDGLWDMVSEEVIQQTIQEEKGAEKVSKKLLQKANDAGGMDNITVLTVFIG